MPKLHLTLAYLKKGMAASYVGAADFEGKELIFSSLTWSPHTGARVEIPLLPPMMPESGAVSVYSSQEEDESHMATASRFIKLSDGWQAKLAELQASAKEAGLPHGIDMVLSDGRILKSLKVMDAATVQSDIEVTMSGVVITSMTPGVGPQADDTANLHPAKTDIYPTVRPEKQAQYDAEHAARVAVIHDPAFASIKSDIEEAIQRMIVALETYAASNKTTQSIITASTGVSPTTPSMKLEDLKQLQASVKTLDKPEDLRAAFASVATFAEEIARLSEEQFAARQTAETASATAATSLSQVQAQLADLTKKHDSLVQAQAVAAAEQAYQSRRATVEEIFAFDAETEAELVEEIKACTDDASFSKWLTRAKKLFKVQTREAIEAAKKADDKKGKSDPVEPDADDKDKKAKAAVNQVIASAVAAPVDTPVTNIIDPTVNTKSLADRYKEVFARNVTIGGRSVEELNTEAAATVKLTR